MIGTKTVHILLALSALCYQAHPQDDWTLQDQQAGIYIYTRTFPDSRFKAIRVKCTVHATLSRLTGVILDVNNGTQWVYGTKSSILLKQVSPSELYYYSVVNLPWPLTDRDFVAHLTAVQDPKTRVVTIDGPTLANYIPAKKGLVRVPSGEGKWILTPQPGGRVAIDYTLRTDPGGSLPPWLVNLFVTAGPKETFNNLKAQLEKTGVTAGFIKDE
jgi:hypothetical protein